jgi:hypothetical protein
MYRKILVGTCLTEYCDHIFRFALNLAKEHSAKLWIYHGLGRLNMSEQKSKKPWRLQKPRWRKLMWAI